MMRFGKLRKETAGRKDRKAETDFRKNGKKSESPYYGAYGDSFSQNEAMRIRDSFREKDQSNIYDSMEGPGSLDFDK